MKASSFSKKFRLRNSGLLPEEALPRGPLSLSANLVKVGAHVHVEGCWKDPWCGSVSAVSRDLTSR